MSFFSITIFSLNFIIVTIWTIITIIITIWTIIIIWITIIIFTIILPLSVWSVFALPTYCGLRITSSKPRLWKMKIGSDETTILFRLLSLSHKYIFSLLPKSTFTFTFTEIYPWTLELRSPLASHVTGKWSFSREDKLGWNCFGVWDLSYKYSCMFQFEHKVCVTYKKIYVWTLGALLISVA